MSLIAALGSIVALSDWIPVLNADSVFGYEAPTQTLPGSAKPPPETVASTMPDNISETCNVLEHRMPVKFGS